MNTINIKDVKFMKEVPAMLVLKVKDVIFIAIVMFILGFVFGGSVMSRTDETQPTATEITKEAK